jgi:hypothetical protein
VSSRSTNSAKLSAIAVRSVARKVAASIRPPLGAKQIPGAQIVEVSPDQLGGHDRRPEIGQRSRCSGYPQPRTCSHTHRSGTAQPEAVHLIACRPRSTYTSMAATSDRQLVDWLGHANARTVRSIQGRPADPPAGAVRSTRAVHSGQTRRDLANGSPMRIRRTAFPIEGFVLDNASVLGHRRQA